MPELDQRNAFALMTDGLARLKVLLNVCRPMVALESEPVGTTCLRARLFFCIQEKHAYMLAVEIQDATNPFEIRRVLQRVLAIPSQ